jgi:ADP-heptose:LPS heptosyltransferase
MKQLVKKMGQQPAQIFDGNLGIVDFCALISMAKLHWGGDSGSIHISQLVDTPTVSWFRDYQGRIEWEPWKDNCHVLIGKETAQGLIDFPIDEFLQHSRKYTMGVAL